MGGTLQTDAVEKADGSPVDLTGQVADKVWFNMAGTGTVAFNNSFNCSSLIDNGTGNYTVSFTNALADSDFGYQGTSPNTVSDNLVRTASSWNVLNLATSNGSFTDASNLSALVVGDLA